MIPSDGNDNRAGNFVGEPLGIDALEILGAVEVQNRAGRETGDPCGIRGELGVQTAVLDGQFAAAGIGPVGKLPCCEDQVTAEDGNTFRVIGKSSRISISDVRIQENLQGLAGENENSGLILNDQAGAVGAKVQPRVGAKRRIEPG